MTDSMEIRDAGRGPERRPNLGRVVRMGRTLLVASILLATWLSPPDASSLLAQGTRPPLSDSRTTRNIQQLGQIGGGTLALAVVGEVVFMNDGSRLLAVDVSQPTTPKLLGKSGPAGDVITSIACHRSYCYFVDTHTLYVADVADPRSSAIVARYDTVGEPVEVAIESGLLYLVDKGSGLRVMSLSNPEEPMEVAAHPLAEASSVAVQGEFIFMTSRSGLLQVIQRSGQDQLELAGSLTLTGTPIDVAVDSGMAYVAAGLGGLHIVDIADRSALRAIGTVAPRDEDDFALSVAAADGFAFLIKDFDYVVVDVSPPSSAHEIARQYSDWPINWSGAKASPSPVIERGLVFIPERFGGLKIWNVTEPTVPDIVGTLDTVGQIRYLHADGDTLYALNYNRLRVVDISSPSEPKPLGTVRFGFYGGLSIDSLESLILVAAGRDGLHLIDVENRSNPTVIVTVPAETEANAVAGYRDTAYLADGEVVRILDVTDPRSPRQVGLIPVPGLTTLTVDGSRLFVGSAGSVRLYNIESPARPTLAATLTVERNVTRISVFNDLLYVTTDLDFGTTTLFNITNPSMPQRLGTLPAAGTVAATVQFAYVAGLRGLSVFDMTDPGKAVEVGHFRRGFDRPEDLALVGDTVLMGEGQHGVVVLRHIGEIPTRCEDALPITPNASLYSELAPQSQGHTVRLDVPVPFTKLYVDVDVTGTAAADVLLFGTCAAGDSGRGAGAGSGRHIGAGSGRHIGTRTSLVKNVLSQAGTYYISTRPPLDATAVVPYRLSVRLDAPDPDAVVSLILTSESQIELEHGAAEVERLRSALHRLGDDPRVNGIVIPDVASAGDTNPEVAAAYARWSVSRNDPALANEVAKALRDWIWRQRTSFPNLRYLVLVGNDRVIPFHRVKIDPLGEPPPNWQTEQGYAAQYGIDQSSTVGSALVKEFTLSDDIYASPVPKAWSGPVVAVSELYVPDLAIGRLVESPTEMTAAVNAFLASSDGIVVDEPLLAGYGYMQDGVQRAAAQLKGGGIVLRPSDLLLTDWTVETYLDRLLNGLPDLHFLGAPGGHTQHRMPDDSLVTADVLRAGLEGAQNKLFYSLAGHSGLNVPDEDGGAASVTLDLPQVWLGKGATVVGSTGWVYGQDSVVSWQERLLADFTDVLLEAAMGRAVGDALQGVKYSYFEDRQNSLTAMDAKSLVGTVLYGLPMQQVSIDQAPIVRPALDPLIPDLSENTPRVESVAPGVAVRRGHVRRFPAELMVRETAASGGEYFRFGGRDVYAMDGEPIQPQYAETLFEVAVDGAYLPPRSILVTGGTSREVVDFEPAIAHMGAISPSMPPARDLSVIQPNRWFPAELLTFGKLDVPVGTSPVVLGKQFGRVVFRLGQYRHRGRVQRNFDSLRVDEYYSMAEDRTPPVIEAVRGFGNDRDIMYQVRVKDASGIERVTVAFGTEQGEWQSTELSFDADSLYWTGHVPARSSGFVQAVDSAGNVGYDPFGGRYYDDRSIPSISVNYIPSIYASDAAPPEDTPTSIPSASRTPTSIRQASRTPTPSIAPPARSATPTPLATPLVTPVTRLELEREAEALINAARQDAGVAALVPVEALALASRRHSRDMAAHGFLESTGSDGSTAGSRIRDAGYEFRTYGTSIARGYSTASALVDGLLASEGNAKLLLSEVYEDLGVGHASTQSGVDYWTVTYAVR